MPEPSSVRTVVQGRLVGSTVVVTRPAGTARSLLASARARGATALALPGLALRATPTPSGARAQLLAAGQVDACVFSSPTAVRYAFRLLPSLQLPRRIFAIGGGSARALATQQLQAIVPQGRSDSEGLLALPELTDVCGQRIVVVGAPGGRDLIAPALRLRGADVQEIHVYERAAPRLSRRHFDALAHADDPLITLLSSAQALVHLVALLPTPLLARLRRQTLVVSSERLVDIGRRNAFANIVRATSAMPADLLDAAARALAHHRL
ncbi:MAG: uroporphyrinogen-III synthase [Dokdonella sp.]